MVRESPSALGKLRALVESGQTSTALFELGSGIVLQAMKLGLIEKVDWAAINPAPMFPEAKNDYGFGYQYFSTIMAWRKGAKEPKNFVEFFDTKAFRASARCPTIPSTSCRSRRRRPACRSTRSSRSMSISPSRS